MQSLNYAALEQLKPNLSLDIEQADLLQTAIDTGCQIALTLHPTGYSSLQFFLHTPDGGHYIDLAFQAHDSIRRWAVWYNVEMVRRLHTKDQWGAVFVPDVPVTSGGRLKVHPTTIVLERHYYMLDTGPRKGALNG